MAYALRTPQHRGKFRILHSLDRTLGPFDLWTRDKRILLRVFLSSSMDQSYFPIGERSDVGDTAVGLVDALGPGDVYIDVGANSGFLAMAAARATGADGLVIAIEPCGREFVRLLAAVELNGARNVLCVRAALGDRDGVRQLEVASGHTGLNRLRDSSRAAEANRAELVPCFAGDSVLPVLLAGRQVRMVKIDVEGAELEVLRGMRDWLAKARPAFVVVEVTPRWLEAKGGSKQALYLLMGELGYRPRVNDECWQYDEVFVAEPASV